MQLRRRNRKRKGRQKQERINDLIMLKASALFYAIVISVLVGMASGSLILSAYFTRLETDTYLKQEQLQLNAASGIAYLLSSQEEIQPGQPATIDLYGSGKDSTILEKKAWGAYEIALSRAIWNGREVKAAALTGSLLQSKDRFVLWLADQDRPLSLAGSTIIKGDAYLPKAGVQRAYIEGQSYAGDKMIYGNVKESGRTMRLFDKALAERLQKIMLGQLSETDSVAAITDDDSISNSFFNAPVIIRSAGKIVLSGKMYAGHIVIISGKEIIVRKDAMIDGVILAAPIIRIEKEFEGTVQAFASDSLMVDEKCTLLYPSALGIIRTKGSADNMYLAIGMGSTVRGAILSWQGQYDVRKTMLINIAQQSEVKGQIYSMGLLDLKGTVKGSVVTSKFLLKTSSSVYENHLLNATIDITGLPKKFGGPIIEKSSKVVVKWLE